MKASAAALQTTSTTIWQSLTQSRWAWCLLIVAIYVFPTISDGFASLNANLGDTDDAVRLLQVRAWMDGAGWFNTTLPKIGGATPLVSHWSRLIDVPIALLITLFSFAMPIDAAETAARFLWPTLVLLGFLRVLVHEADIREGPAPRLSCWSCL